MSYSKVKFKCKPLQIIALLFVVFVVVWYFLYYSCAIGTPCAATIKYGYRDFREVSLSGAQLEELSSILRDSLPTCFVREAPGMNNDVCLITLHYADGSIKEYSLWFLNTILYEGRAEDMTMDCMYGSIFHFGGLVDSDMDAFLRRFFEEP
ncbi:MAG: hypothetical protein IKJ58_03405 [Akkermansia sp.]|nr:hypothetical protein [Akkermansia sp.]